jgi:hypothetical protein
VFVSTYLCLFIAMPGCILYAPSGSGKSYYVNKTHSVSGYTLIDGDNLYDWPPGRWWLDTKVAEQVEKEAMDKVYEYVRSHDKVIVFTGLPIQADVTVLIPREMHISFLEKREGSVNQPTNIHNIDRTYRSGVDFSSFDTAVHYLISKQ